MFHEDRFKLARDDFIRSARMGKVPGLDICEDGNGKLIVSVKGGKYSISETESMNMRGNDDDW